MDFDYQKWLNISRAIVYKSYVYSINHVEMVNQLYLNVYAKNIESDDDIKKELIKIYYEFKFDGLCSIRKSFEYDLKEHYIWQLDMQCKKCKELLPYSSFYSFRDKYGFEKTHQTCKKCMFVAKYNDESGISVQNKYLQKTRDELSDMYCKHILRLRGYKNPTKSQIEAQRQSIIDARKNKETVICQFNKNGVLIAEYNNRKELFDLGFCKTKISLVLQGKRKSHKGFSFKYKNQD